MTSSQALMVAGIVLARLSKMPEVTEKQFYAKYGISSAEIINALPIIEALETVERARS